MAFFAIFSLRKFFFPIENTQVGPWGLRMHTQGHFKGYFSWPKAHLLRHNFYYVHFVDGDIEVRVKYLLLKVTK